MSKKSKPKTKSDPFYVFRILKVKGGDYALATYQADGTELQSVELSNEDLQSIILQKLEDKILDQCRENPSTDLIEFADSLKH